MKNEIPHTTREKRKPLSNPIKINFFLSMIKLMVCAKVRINMMHGKSMYIKYSVNTVCDLPAQVF